MCSYGVGPQGEVQRIDKAQKKREIVTSICPMAESGAKKKSKKKKVKKKNKKKQSSF